MPQWVDQFIARHGRPPRVLHLGNVANNAYLNAGLLRRLGIDCDVLSPDYYHLMGTPEWEHADFNGEITDHFHPAWYRVDLGGFERPRWFVAGPLELAIPYLLARTCGHAAAAERLWRLLGYVNRTTAVPLLERPAHHARKLASYVRRGLHGVSDPPRLRRKLEELRARSENRNRWTAQARAVVWPPLLAVTGAASRLLHGGRRMVPNLAGGDRWFADRTAELISRYDAAFPDRSDRLAASDLYQFKPWLAALRQLFRRYDLTIAYGTFPVFPMVAGARYFALEHGTLRELPYRADSTGRLTALSYHMAERVFVTNSDCMQNARRLAGERAEVLPHPFDEHAAGAEPGAPEEERRRYLHALDATLLLFMPTRHDWVAGTGFADKGNDRFLRAFARLRGDGLRVGLICCDWGRNVDASKQLLQALGCSRYVAWRAPMGSVAFARTMRAVDAIVDQFVLGAFGGVTFRGLAAGRPVCTYLEASEVAATYGEAPPVINCRTEEEIACCLGAALRDPMRMAALGEAGLRWIERHHAGRRTALQEMERLRQVLMAELCDAVSA